MVVEVLFDGSCSGISYNIKNINNIKNIQIINKITLKIYH